MGPKRRLLVVEDHPTTARALKMFLETQGYHVIVAETVAAAVKTAAETEFHLLICDLSLPDGNGWDLMKKLSTKRWIRGIAYTASGNPEDIAQSKKVGFLEHLVKGCSTEDLIRSVEQALEVPARPARSRSSATE